MNDVVIRLTWSSTSDFFDIKAIDSEFANWFVQECTKNGNNYIEVTGNPSLNLGEVINQLKHNISCVNDVFKKIKIPQLPIYDDLYDQSNLNKTHKAWISIVRKDPTIDKLLYHVSPLLFNQFHNINYLVHQIESNSNYQLVGSTPWRIDNKFKNIIPLWRLSNVSIVYADWGKSSFHKFVDCATDPNDFELSNWNNISPNIKIQLTRPYHSEMPKEYIDYCNTHQILPTVNHWPLGDLLNYNQNVGRAREIMDCNIRIPNNHLSFSIV